MGGLLHAGRLPFTGLFISSAAVIFISLIGFSSKKRGIILNATITVLIIKGLVSPHTPPNAYFAVFFQGLMGEILFAMSRFYRLTALLLGIICLLQSALQKLFIITLVFGFTFWNSIDIFTAYILKQLPLFNLQATDIRLSIYLIAFYIAIHLSAGIIAGWFAGTLPHRIEKQKKHLSAILKQISIRENITTTDAIIRKKWWKRPKKIVLFLFLLSLIIISYFDTGLYHYQFSKTMIMVIRSLLIMNLWFFFISPLIMKYFNRFMNKKRRMNEGDVKIIMRSIPQIKTITLACWEYSSHYKFTKRFFVFMELLFMVIINGLSEAED